jgi:CheY-like chemotaxis protein
MGGLTQLNADKAAEPAAARILIVEDDSLVSFAIAEALRDLGASVVEVTTADEAWDYLATGAPVDVVFSDHVMPGSMTGAQLVARVKEHYPEIKTVITSGYVDIPDRPAQVLSKPYDVLKTAADLSTMATQNRQKG